MGEGILGHISKGVILTKLDALLNHTDSTGQFDKRAAFLAALNQAVTPAQYQHVLETQAGVTTAESNYLKATWYDPGGWWPDPQSAFLIVRKGLIKAIEVAAAGKGLLLDSYWLPAAPAGVIEVIVCRSDRQVTRVILTPPSPAPVNPRHTDAPMWVIKPKIGLVQQGDDTYNEVVESVDGNVVTWRVREMP